VCIEVNTLIKWIGVDRLSLISLLGTTHKDHNVRGFNFGTRRFYSKSIDKQVASSLFSIMDPALDILNRALKGDSGALSFLERTVAIYVFDRTNPGKPKIRFVEHGTFLIKLWQKLSGMNRALSRHHLMPPLCGHNINNSTSNTPMLTVTLMTSLTWRVTFNFLQRCPVEQQNDALHQIKS
jgi:hypothetical protein